MAIGPSLRGTLGRYLPTWLGNVPGLRNLFSVVWTVATLGDAMREWALEGQYANYPGVGTDTALPYIGATRGLVQGPLETSASFATRCINWLKGIALLGSPVGIVTEVQAFLVSQGSLGAGVLPVVVFIDRAGNRTSISASKVVTRDVVSWDWDTEGGWTDDVGHKSELVVENWWSDGWLIIQDPYTHYTGFADANWLAAWNSGDQTVDSLCPQQVVVGLQGIVDFWKGAHVFIRCIVWTASPTSFVPTHPGHWGNWSESVAGVQTARRSGSLSYWQPPQGG